jgi:hypothetical protein
MLFQSFFIGLWIEAYVTVAMIAVEEGENGL